MAIFFLTWSCLSSPERSKQDRETMQVQSGAEHFGKMINNGIITPGSPDDAVAPYNLGNVSGL
jgi:hypothetical protein